RSVCASSPRPPPAFPTRRSSDLGMGNMGSQYAALLAAGAVPGMELAAVTRVRPETLAARGLALPAGLPVYQTAEELFAAVDGGADRKSTRLNSSHVSISYAVFCW